MVNVPRNIDNVAATFSIGSELSTVIADGSKIMLTRREADYLNHLITQRTYIKKLLSDNDNLISSFIDEVTGKGG